MTTVHLRDLLFVYGYPLLFLVSLIEGTGMPGPVELFFIASGFLISRGEMTLPLVCAVGTVGNVVGNLAGYMLGRWGGRPLFNQIVRHLRLSESGIERTERWFRSFGGMAQAISRLVGVTRTPAIIGAGVMRVPIGPFLVGSFVGDAVWSVFWTLAGVGVGANIAFVRAHQVLGSVLLVVLLGVTAVVWYYVHRRLRRL